jgi:hypothetical protein
MENKTPKTVTPVPEITPELLEKNAAWQKEMLDGVVLPSQESIFMGRHRVIVRDTLRTIQSLRDKAKATNFFNTATATENSEYYAVMSKLHQNIGESLLQLGEFEKAAEYFADDDRKAHALALHEAMNIDDDENCDCPDDRIEIDTGGREHKFDNRFREQTIFSKKHGRPMSVIRCNLCGFRNIQEIPDSIKAGQEIRAAAVRAG